MAPYSSIIIKKYRRPDSVFGPIGQKYFLFFSGKSLPSIIREFPLDIFWQRLKELHPQQEVHTVGGPLYIN
jgi:hypothetical protein